MRMWENMGLMEWVLLYWLGINVVAFLLYGVDKWKAKRAKWRISEATLIWMAVLGGSVGALLGIKLWHHKTLHAKFRYGVPTILIAQVLLAAWIAYYLFGM